MNKEHTIKTYKELSKIPYGHADTSITPGCIVVEGGAFRGLYNQGVLDALMENNLNFACTIGTSAGALAGFNYAAGQIGRTYRHYTDYVGRGALAHAHSPIRMDFLFNDYNAIEPFDEKTFFSPQRRFVAVATDCTTGKTAYFEKGKCRDIFSAIKASASMPYISPMVYVDGRPCLDGGCSCRIPWTEGPAWMAAAAAGFPTDGHSTKAMKKSWWSVRGSRSTAKRSRREDTGFRYTTDIRNLPAALPTAAAPIITSARRS